MGKVEGSSKAIDDWCASPERENLEGCTLIAIKSWKAPVKAEGRKVTGKERKL